MVETLQDLGEHIVAKLGAAVTATKLSFGELTIEANAAGIVSVLTFLRDDAECGFVCFVDICGADYPERDKRFDVVYHLLAPYKNRRIRVKVQADEDTQVPSSIPVFPAANWFERETFDLYGVLFAGHPDLRRILTDYGFSGHPLRKDFPLTGHVEVRYDDGAKRVVYEPVKLVQEFRSFDYLSPWEGTDYILPGDEKAKV
jgi:NADH-quinone oxidoreductase subunit C